VFVKCFKMRNLSGNICHLHLVNEIENVKCIGSEMTEVHLEFSWRNTLGCVAQIWTLSVTPGHGMVFRSAAANQNTTYA
jgi:hypothetical protein